MTILLQIISSRGLMLRALVAYIRIEGVWDFHCPVSLKKLR